MQSQSKKKNHFKHKIQNNIRRNNILAKNAQKSSPVRNTKQTQSRPNNRRRWKAMQNVRIENSWHL